MTFNGRTGRRRSRRHHASAAGHARPWIKFEAEIAGGSLYVGSPDTVATKLAATIRLLGLSRFDLAYATGRVPHEQRMATIELYGREVIPRVRELLERLRSNRSVRSDAAANNAGSPV